MECEVCGREIFGRAYTVVIDRAKLVVCSDCSKAGSPPPRQEAAAPRPPPRRVTPVRPRAGSRPPAQDLVFDDAVVMDGYGKRIRRGREKLGLTHEELSRKIGEKVSLLQKLETEKMTPDLALAKKLESTLRIKLLGVPASSHVGDEVDAHRPTDLTLGDIVVMQKQEEP